LVSFSRITKESAIFDFGNGMNGHFNWDMVERAMTQGFRPDTFSTDWNAMSRTTGVVDFANVMSKFFVFGMSLSQIIARATVNAAHIFPAFSDRGTLGAPADVALLELRGGTFEFLDNYKGTRTGRQRKAVLKAQRLAWQGLSSCGQLIGKTTKFGSVGGHHEVSSASRPGRRQAHRCRGEIRRCSASVIAAKPCCRTSQS
jgi:predicted amidohydrolase